MYKCVEIKTDKMLDESEDILVGTKKWNGTSAVPAFLVAVDTFVK